MPVRTLVKALFCLIAVSTEASDVLLYEDFQDGTSDGWRAFGSGTMSITNYAGNASLRMTKDSMVARAVPVSGLARVRVGASFAAMGLDTNESCIAEASTDNGETWTEILNIGEAQADGLTLHSGATSIDLDSASRTLWVRARTAGNRDSDTCWLDNVYVVGATDGDRPAPTSPRKLTAGFLNGDAPLTAPLPLAEFTPAESEELPSNAFSGALTLLDPASAGDFDLVADDFQRIAAFGDAIRHLPDFSFDIVQRGSDLVPLRQGLQRRDHPYWEIMLLPGRVWQDPADGEWSRAALPFALQERSANCTHNGVLTWLFRDNGEISRVAYQVSSETCGYLKFDMWGVLGATYEPRNLEAEAEPILARLDAHRELRLPVRALSELGADYPGTEPLGFGLDDGINPADMTVMGMVVDGVHYRSDCFTRHGPFPFCDSLPLSSYSTAKSMFGGIALMRLEALYPGISKTTIQSLVEECDGKRWDGVTIEHALDMATGNYRSATPNEDEDSTGHVRFIYSDNHADKIEAACTLFRNKDDPGSKFVYHTSDTYLVGTALQAWVKDKLAADKDLYTDVLVGPIWNELGLSLLLDDSKRTYDDVAQPFTGYGLTYESDDIARIAAWLLDGATLTGEPALDPEMLDAALHRSASDPGLPAGFPGVRYNNGFWAFDAGPSLGCERPVWIPFMSGVSGITVALFPNDIIYYYYSDSYAFRWGSARRAAHAMRNLCQ